MCNRYVSPDQAAIERFWHIGGRNPPRWWAPEIYPKAQGPFLRAADGGPELVVGQWGLIPFFAKTATLTYSTNNARAEELAAKPTFREPWKRGHRCIIPAVSFDEPCWETGRNVWWRFRRADGAPWGLAGLWNTWLDKATGELVESYTMLTLNADAHPLMRRMHKPEPDLPADAQDKRSVIPIEAGDVEQWLRGTLDEARSLLRLAPTETFDAGPVTAASQSSLL
ncbi:MAG TPA: SOS response-associated peptidase family protein [Burkholderiaceae bacterium]|nr:SOS response-associated peptidase family protein [Burkholderiaceae bacterium]